MQPPQLEPTPARPDDTDPAGHRPGVVLVVEDERISRALLCHQVERAGHCAVTADNGRLALEILRTRKCDLVLLDVLMPEMDGLAVLEHVRADPVLRDLPIVVISGLGEISTAARCIEAGAEDYIIKPFDPTLLKARIAACLEKKRLRDQETAYLRQLEQLKARLEDSNRELEEANRKLARAALTDVLTGLPNRRFALELLGRCWSGTRRHKEPLACLLIDVDNFKRFNDAHGHDVGDAVLQATAAQLRAAARAEESVCRLGGEEFVVMCEGADRGGAFRAGERLRESVAARPVRFGGGEYAVTVSVGVAVREPLMTHPDHLLKAADQAVYAAKQAGRNRTCLYPPVEAGVE